MTRLLVSVRSPREAQLALDAGVDLVDIKEPRRGSLGAAAVETIDSIARLVANRVPVSAALGELMEFDPHSIPALAGIRYIKLGLAGCAPRSDWPQRWQSAWRALPDSCGRIAVAYADWRSAGAPEPAAVLDDATPAGCAGLLIDTWDKRSGDLFCHLCDSEIQQLAARARQAGLMFVLAGGLRGQNVKRARDLQPDFVAVRGAVCGSGRDGDLVESLLVRLVDEFRDPARTADSLNSAARPEPKSRQFAADRAI